VAFKRNKQPQRPLVVKVIYISVPGAETRLAQAIDLLLKKVAMDTTNSQDNADSDREKAAHQRVVRDPLPNRESEPLDTPKS
jgi:hypothetical protein